MDSHLISEVIEKTQILAPEFSLAITLSLALILDKLLGEAKRFHYLVGFGYLATKLAALLNISLQNQGASTQVNAKQNILKTKALGTIAWCLLVLPLPILYLYFLQDLVWYWQVFIDAIVLYLALGLTSLKEHAMQIYRPLKSGDLKSARHFTGYIVSRETSQLSEQEISRATVESMLENGHDAVIASLVYYIIGGAPLVILHRLANTLDAMWGYKNARFINFGYASARLDDLLGFISGKCCTLLYAIQGLKQRHFIQAIANAYRQGNQYKSHNGGWVMAAGATVMNRQLGGSAHYHGKKIHSVTLGEGCDASVNKVSYEDIPASLKLVSRASLLLLIAVFVFQLFIYLQ